MKNPLENNTFCTALILLSNAILIGGIFLMARYLGKTNAKTILFTMYPLMIFGNIVVRLVMRDGSRKLAKNYLYIIIALVILFAPLAMIF